MQMGNQIPEKTKKILLLKSWNYYKKWCTRAQLQFQMQQHVEINNVEQEHSKT